MYSSNYRSLVDALILDKYSIEFKKVNISRFITNYVTFSYGRNERYIIEVNTISYETTMWYYDGDGHNLLLTSSIDEKLKELGQWLLSYHLSDIMKAENQKD